MPLFRKVLFQAVKANKMSSAAFGSIIDEFISSISKLKVNLLLLRSLQRLRNLGWNKKYLVHKYLTNLISKQVDGCNRLY